MITKLGGCFETVDELSQLSSTRMATIRKALRFSWRGKRYSVVDGKQSDYFNTPKPTRSTSSASRIPGANSDGESPESDDLHHDHAETRRQIPRRSDRLTQSVRDAVGTLKQVLHITGIISK